MRYNIFICDDEPEMIRRLSENIKNILEECGIRSFSDGYSLLGEMGNCDILLLDIDMPGITGLDIAGRLSGLEKRPLFAFVTSHDELVYDSLRFHPFGFVRKSHMEEELPALLVDCVKELSGRERHFCFQSGGARIKLPLGDILYFEAEGNYLRVFMTQNGRGEPGRLPGAPEDAGGGYYRFRETLAGVETSLIGDGFVRIHKGFLVNQAAVRSLGADEVVLINGAHIPVGRSYANDAKRKLMKWMLGT